MASSLNASTAGGGGVIVTSDASGNLNIQSGGSTVVAVTSAGATVTGTLSATGASTFTGTGKFATTIGVGNATPAASGSGITFPASQSASSDANTLDDYEEGTFTPTIIGTSTAGTGTYTNQVGTYTKVGRIVYINLQLTWSAHTGTGTMEIGGLPFTVTGNNAAGGLSVGSVDNLALPAGTYLIVGPVSGTSRIYLQSTATGGAGSATQVTLDTAADLRVGGVYQAA